MIRTDDAALLASIAEQRDEHAFTAFYLRHAQSARMLALRKTRNFALADDVLQDSMLQVWCRAGTFRPGNARAWLFQIVNRECIRKLQRAHAMDSRHAAATQYCPAAEEPEVRIHLSSLKLFIDELPRIERVLVRLRFGDGLTLRQISVALSMPQRTVSHRLKLAVERLRKRCEPQMALN